MKKRILIIDDDPLVTKIVSQILTRLGGFETLVINTPESTLAAASEFRPDALVLDYRMPSMSGEEVLSALRQCDDFQRIPALLLSGDGSWGSARPDKFTGILEKPITAKALIAAVQAILGEAEHTPSLAA